MAQIQNVNLVNLNNYTNVQVENLNLDNYYCTIEDNMIQGGTCIYGSKYILPTVRKFAFSTAETWEISCKFLYINGHSSYPTVFGSATTEITDSVTLHIASGRFRLYIPKVRYTWMYSNIDTGITPVNNTYYWFKFGQTSDYTYYLDYATYNGSAWSSFTRAWSAQPTTIRKNTTDSQLMFLNSAIDTNRHTLSKMSLDDLKVTINGEVVWSAVKPIQVGDIVKVNNGLGITDNTYTASNALVSRTGSFTEDAQVVSITNDIAEVTPKAIEEYITVITPKESGSEITATIDTYGDVNEEITITTDETAEIESNSYVDCKNTCAIEGFINSNLSMKQGYRLFSMDVPSDYTYYVEYNGRSYTTSEFPIICREGDYVTYKIFKSGTKINENQIHILSGRDIHYKKIRITSDTVGASVYYKINGGTEIHDTYVYAYPGDTVTYVVAAPGYCSKSGSYKVPFVSVSTDEAEYTTNITLDTVGVTYTIDITPADANVKMKCSNKVFTGGSSKYVETKNAINLGAANSWEVSTTYTYKGGGSEPMVFCSGSGNYCGLLLIVRSGVLQLYATTASNTWNIFSAQSMGITMATNTTYYFKLGFTGTNYYLDYKTNPSDQYTNAWTSATKTNKVYSNTKFQFLDWGYNLTYYYSSGIIDLKETTITLDSVVVFDGSTAVEGTDYTNKDCAEGAYSYQFANSITVPSGKDIFWSASKFTYETKSGVKNITEDTTDTLTLGPQLYVYTIDPLPSDARVILTAQGYTQSGNSISVGPDTNITWSVDKAGYTTKTGSAHSISFYYDTPFVYKTEKVALMYDTIAIPDLSGYSNSTAFRNASPIPHFTIKSQGEDTFIRCFQDTPYDRSYPRWQTTYTIQSGNGAAGLFGYDDRKIYIISYTVKGWMENGSAPGRYMTSWRIWGANENISDLTSTWRTDGTATLLDEQKNQWKSSDPQNTLRGYYIGDTVGYHYIIFEPTAGISDNYYIDVGQLRFYGLVVLD